MRYKVRQFGGEQDEILQFLQQYAASKGINPQELIADFQQASPEQQQEFLSQLQGETEMQYGGIPKSEKGVFDYPNQPVIVPTRGTGQISMKGVNSPIHSFDANTMEYLDLMQPNQEYQFDGVDDVLEIPVAQFGKGYIFDDKSGTYTDPKTGKHFILKNGKYEELNIEPVRGLNNDILTPVKEKFPVKVGDFRFNPTPTETSTTQYSGNTPVQIASTKTQKDAFVTGLKPFTSRETMLPVYKESWIEEWSGVDPSFKNKSFEQQQKFAREYTQKNNPEYYKGLSNGFKGFNIDKMTSDKKFGSITNQLRPSLVKPMVGNVSSDLDLTNSNSWTPLEGTVSNPPQFTPEQMNSVSNEYVQLPEEGAYTPIAGAVNDLKNLGKLDTRDYSSQYLSNAKLRNNRVMAPYFRRSDLALPDLYQEDVSPYLANINRTVGGAMQNINSNSTVGQATAQQLASNAAFQSNVVQGQVANRNLERKTNWSNSIASIASQQSQIDDSNRAQYSDDWMRTLAAKDNVDNLIDLQAAQFKMNRQKEGNQNVMNAAISSMINPNYDLQIDEDGNILYGVKQGQKFKNPYPAKFGLKRKAL